MIRSALIAIVCFSSLCAHAAEDAPSNFNVPAGELAAALKSLAAQADVEIVYQPQQMKNIRTQGLQGTYSPQEAIALLLKGTLLQVHTDSSGAMVISLPAISNSTKSQERSDAGMRLAETEAKAEEVAVEQKSSPQAPAAGVAAARETKVEEIVVTAQKREERLQDVPISMSVLGGDALDRSTVDGVVEALSRVPGVAIDTIFASGGTQMTIRGAPPSGILIAGYSPVAYYLDSLPFGLVKTTIAPDASAYDLERVEVLRGPQGTLYGASALNGVVRVLTKEANPDAFELKARGLTSSTDGGGWNYRGDMAVNVPIIEGKLAVRGVVGYQDLSGWIDQTYKDNVNDSKLRNYRLKINAQPTEQLSIDASAWFSRSDYGAPPIGDENQRSLATIDTPITTGYDAFGVKVAYEFPRFSFASMSSYIDYENDSLIDIAPIVLFPLSLQSIFQGKVFSQEFNLHSTHEGNWRWSAGGMYRDAEDHRNQTLSIITGPADVTDTSKSVAVFGELTRLFLDRRLELTAGLRYFEDKVTGREDLEFGGLPVPGLYARNSFDSLSPRVILSWLPTEQMTLYASYAEGFRSGFHQNPAVLAVAPSFVSADPDTLKNYELGIKGNWLDGRINLETALYYMDWLDVQQQLIVNYPPCSCGITAVVNSESASGIGLDFALTAKPVEAWELGVNFSWNDLTVDGEVFSGDVLFFSKGDRLNFSPEYTAGVWVDYIFPLGGRGFEGRFSASANFTSERGIRELTSAGDAILTGQSDSILIGRTSFSIDSPNRWGATLFVDNLSNEQGIVTKSGASNPYFDVRSRPRTIGLQLEYRY